jgi:hypothetical protein
MPRSRIQHICLPHFFPPDDPIAVTIARLCILREDLLLEGQAITQVSLGPLDSNGEEWRRLYFWRNAFRTLENIRGALHSLSCRREFKKALSEECEEVQKGFEKLEKALKKVSDEFLKDLRNSLGGHVKETAVSEALKSMDADQKGLLQISDGLVRDQHYKFASVLILQMLLPAGPVKNPKQELKRRSRKAAILMWAALIIDEIFNTYVKSRGLLVS